MRAELHIQLFVLHGNRFPAELLHQRWPGASEPFLQLGIVNQARKRVRQRCSVAWCHQLHMLTIAKPG